MHMCFQMPMQMHETMWTAAHSELSVQIYAYVHDIANIYSDNYMYLIIQITVNIHIMLTEVPSSKPIKQCGVN